MVPVPSSGASVLVLVCSFAANTSWDGASEHVKSKSNWLRCPRLVPSKNRKMSSMLK